ncbi:gamma-glutamyl-gamma-aminobutyrate hydrolase family protein [Streptococcus ratti]|uniref:Gamma-glutamyl-gamma-aminobutyrate hydrolase family protein n=1 Tax=Streptococcus ratti TaxID=1341 RepID=A0A7X9LCA2_STRRT|nr:gamma-glutamyl-gamma-aminobutyrate hydrolase family protein [Streptococcus ratti]NMD48274.1 gamma-glutamyl-gamma-aminobutyrate hydrolase family protein [Streptococcus ratti]
MIKPVIGISANEKPISDKFPIVHLSTSRNFADAVKKAGGIPVYLPISKPEEAADFVSIVDKIILTGGQNIGPEIYEAEKQTDSQDYSPERDRFEAALIKEALKQEKPIFGVCRGLQLYNAVQGGTLHQQIDGHAGKPPTQLAHQVFFEKDNRLQKIFGDSSVINSVHHQSLDQLADGLSVLARSEDGTIEAAQDEAKHFLGVQWHPEFLIEEQSENQDLFTFFVQEI